MRSSVSIVAEEVSAARRFITLRSPRTFPGHMCSPSNSFSALRNRRDGTPKFLAELAEEVASKGRDVLPTMAQWRQIQRLLIEPMKKILAESLVTDHFIKVLICRDNHSHIHFNCSSSSKADDLPPFQHPEELRLTAGTQIADFIEKSVPPLACSK